jgi:hypothetical protein
MYTQHSGAVRPRLPICHRERNLQFAAFSLLSLLLLAHYYSYQLPSSRFISDHDVFAYNEGCGLRRAIQGLCPGCAKANV